MAAAAGALVLHAWLAWAFNELLVGGRPAPTVAVESVLQVVWLAPSAAAPMRRTEPAPRARLEMVAISRPHTRSDAIAAEQAPMPPSPTQPPAAVLQGQARDWAQQQAPLEFAGADPLANRVAGLPGRPANRFRMPAPLSTAAVVGFIGQAFGNGEDPCVRNHANLAAYATGRDASAMDLAVDFDRRHCRP